MLVPDYPFVLARLFDVERPPNEQGIVEGRYDFVIAGNVLHATRKISRVAGHARALLKPDGVLLINEISRKSLLGHLTFGLLDGWWLNEDEYSALAHIIEDGEVPPNLEPPNAPTDSELIRLMLVTNSNGQSR